LFWIQSGNCKKILSLSTNLSRRELPKGDIGGEKAKIIEQTNVQLTLFLNCRLTAGVSL
jgi:hypothetical protein